MSVEYTHLDGDQSDRNDLETNRAEISSTFAFPMFDNIERSLL